MVTSNIRIVLPVALLFLLPIPGNISSAAAGDISVFAVYKRQVFLQTSDQPPVRRCCPYMFDAVVELTDSNAVTAATLGAADNPPIALTPGYLEEFLPRRGIVWVSEGFPDQRELNAKWPEGDYVFSIFAPNDGAITSKLQLAGDLYPTNPPHVLNFNEAQAIDASKDFTLRWSRWADGTTNDFCFVVIRKAGEGTPVINTPFLAEPNALDGTVSAVVIPAGTLAPGEQYDAYVRIDRVLGRDHSSYPGTVGQASFGSGTHFSLKTRSDSSR